MKKAQRKPGPNALKTAQKIPDGLQSWPRSAAQSRRKLAIATILMLTSTLLLLTNLMHRSGTRIPWRRATVKISEGRVALCLSGNSRTFHYPFVHEEILKSLVQPLRAQMRTDIFFNLKLTDNARKGYGNATENSSASLETLRKFNATVVHIIDADETIMPSRHFLPDGKSLPPPAGCASRGSVPFPFALHRGAECLRLIETYEEAHGLQYAYIYRSRPDVAFLETPVLPSQIRENELYTNGIAEISTKDVKKWWVAKHGNHSGQSIPAIGDQFLAGRRDVAALALRAIDTLEDCEFFSIPGVKNSESALSYWLLSHHVNFVADTATWVVVRGGTGPECWRIDMLNVPNGTIHKRMITQCSSYARDFRRQSVHLLR